MGGNADSQNASPMTFMLPNPAILILQDLSEDLMQVITSFSLKYHLYLVSRIHVFFYLVGLFFLPLWLFFLICFYKESQVQTLDMFSSLSAFTYLLTSQSICLKHTHVHTPLSSVYSHAGTLLSSRFLSLAAPSPFECLTPSQTQYV